MTLVLFLILAKNASSNLLQFSYVIDLILISIKTLDLVSGRQQFPKLFQFQPDFTRQEMVLIPKVSFHERERTG